MVVCKYFSQGYCKFGSRCRFEHVRDSEYYGASSYSSSWNPLGNYNQSNENPEQKNKSGPSLTNNSNEDSNTLVNKISLNDLVLIVCKDTLQLEEGNQWPLTCYAPIKEYGNIPNWVDNSPEELRWKLYKSLKNGTYSTCKEAIDNLYREAEERRMNLKLKEKASNIIKTLLNISKVEVGTDIRWKEDLNNQTLNSNSFVSTHSNIPNVPSSVFHLGMDTVPSVQSSNAFSTFVFSLNNQNVNSSYENDFKPVHHLKQHQHDSITVESNLSYSTVEKLSSDELEIFESQTFTFGSIPLKPPPKNLCKI